MTLAPGFDPRGGYSLGGRRVADPWMSAEAMPPDMVEWLEASSVRSATRHGTWPHAAALAEALEAAEDRSARSWQGETAFGSYRTDVRDAAFPSRLVLVGATGDETVAYDPVDHLDIAGLPRLIFWVEPSPDRKTLALGTSADGDECMTIEFLDIETAALRPHRPLPLFHSSGNRIQWHSDSRHVTFIGLQGGPLPFDNQVFTYGLDDDELVRQDIPWRRRRDFRAIHVSAGDRGMVASEGYGAPSPIAIARRNADDRWVWAPFLRTIDEATFGHLVDDGYLAITYNGCDRGRVVLIDPSADDRDDPTTWVELVPESDLVLISLTPVAETIYLHGRAAGRSALAVHERNGRLRTRLELPDGLLDTGYTALYAMDVPPTAATYSGSLSTLGQSATRFTSSPARAPQVEIDSVPAHADSRLLIERATIRDRAGSETLLTRLRRRDLPDGPRPTLIQAYGGFNDWGGPRYDRAASVFAASGGEVVWAHISGDGDRGRAVWQRGRRESKQRCYDDIFAVAEHLISTGSASTFTLALMGASNGGLMSAVCALQRPDLWRAVVCLAGWVDPLGGVRFPFLDLCARMELGDLDGPDVVERVLQISPLSLAQRAASHPAMYLETGDLDTRVPAWSTAKLVAELTRRSIGSVDFRLWRGAGHGEYDPPHLALERTAAWLGFLMAELGLAPEGSLD